MAPAMEGAVTAVPDPRPAPAWRPWWTLGVSERAYRMVLPQGPLVGTLTPEQTAHFWSAYSHAREESVLLDAAELALLAAPSVVLLGGALLVPFLGLPMFAARFKLTGSAADKLVGAAFVLTPVVSLATIGFAALCGLVTALPRRSRRGNRARRDR